MMDDRLRYWQADAGRRLRRRSLLAASGITAVALLGCGKSARTPSAPAASSAAGAKPKPGGTVSVAQTSDPFDWDVTYLGKNTPNTQGISLAYTPALRFHTGPDVQYTDLKLEPALVDRWETPDAQTFTFHLRPGVTFASVPPVNGRPLTSADIKFSWEYASRTGEFANKGLAAGATAGQFSGLGSVQTPDAQTAVATFSQPYIPFLNYAAYTWFAIMPRETFEQYGSFKDHIAGTGPFQLDTAASQKGSKWVWKKNPFYWEPGQPYLDQVVWLILPDTATQNAAFQTRQLDIITASDHNVAAQLQKLRPDAHLDDYLSLAPVHVYIEAERPPLNDLRVRQAISLSIDRDEWVKTYAPGKGGWALAGAFPDTYSQQEIRGLLKTDRTQARQLLAAAGYPNGVPLEILSAGEVYGDVYVQQSELLQAQLNQGGFNVSIKTVEKSEYVTLLEQKHQFQIVFTGKQIAPDVDSYLTVFEPGKAENYAQINDSVLTDMIHKQRAEPDAAKRRDLVRQAAKRINSDQVWAQAIFYPAADQLWNPALQGYGPNFGHQGWPLHGAWLSA